ncbi:MAG: hypothetical protein OXB87_02090, partial [Hyphomicrobiales bacterium]|nr:hypothetical protein [Hyphomicrobiales bacterium]
MALTSLRALAASVAAAVWLAGFAAAAHEVRPAYLRIVELPAPSVQSADSADAGAWLYEVSWRRPVREGQSLMALLPLRPVFPPGCEETGPRRAWHRPGMRGEEFRLRCAASLRGQVIGLE